MTFFRERESTMFSTAGKVKAQGIKAKHDAHDAHDKGNHEP